MRSRSAALLYETRFVVSSRKAWLKRPRRGFFVRAMTAQDFVDIYNVRLAIECAAARLVAQRRPSLAAIEETIRLLHEAARRGDVSSTVDLELLVHRQICDASGNAFLRIGVPFGRRPDAHGASA